MSNQNYNNQQNNNVPSYGPGPGYGQGYGPGYGQYGPGYGYPQMSDKSKVLAAILCFFLGGFGVHRFYLGDNAGGAAMLIVFIIGLVTSGVFIGFFICFGIGIWSFVDFIRILTGGLTDKYGRPLS